MVSTLKMLETTSQAWAQPNAVYEVFSPLCNLTRSSLWREFTAGVSLLRNHLGHFNADLTRVARSNLRLLHQNFDKNRLYKESLASLRKSTQINWRSISAEHSLLCGILHIPAGMGLDLIRRDMDENLEKIPGLSNNNALSMFYIISGGVEISDQETSRKFSLFKFPRKPKLWTKLKTDQAMLIPPKSSACQPHCRAQRSSQILVVSYISN